jgi:hypothetical protein
MSRDALFQAIEVARGDDPYQNYLTVRERVLDMVEEARGRSDQPSDYWSQELAGLDYMLDASPLIVQKLREHCHHLTGLRAYEYRGHHAQQGESFAKKLEALRREDDDGLFVPESPLLGGFGHQIDGALINVDTLKFYECLIALSRAGLLAQFRSEGGRGQVVMEIGAGWGGFAYQFKTLYPHVTYVIVDLPMTLLFSAVYLKTLFPNASVFMYGDGPVSTFSRQCESYDFAFLPHYSMDSLKLSKLDLAINMVSFQEMTSEQVEQYVRKAHELGCRSLYSLNRDRSRYNSQLSTVASLIGRYYDLTEVNVLDVAYTEMTLPRPKRSALGTLKAALSSPRSAAIAAIQLAVSTVSSTSRRESVHVYRHLAGTRKGRTASADGTRR